MTKLYAVYVRNIRKRTPEKLVFSGSYAKCYEFMLKHANTNLSFQITEI